MATLTKENRKTKTVYEQLVDECLPLVEHYQADLLVHDKNIIQEHSGVPFLHWTRQSGTWIVFLYPSTSDRFPPRGVEVPYLFGKANREHIATQIGEVAEGIEKMSNTLLTHYFDGKRLKRITVKQATEIAKDYVRRTLDDFRRDNQS